MSSDAPSFSAPKGTYDLLPPRSAEWQAAVRLALDDFARAGYEPVETPLFEATGVFERGVGHTTEVVGKQMYTFTDQGGRSLTLRPEGTAPVMRAVLEHHLERGPLPIKLAYAGAMFRQERPQKGRYRQFFQVGAEAIGSASPLVDAEVIELAERYVRSLGVEAALLLNSIGHPAPECRHGYRQALAAFLEDHVQELAPEDRARASANPMRAFDSKEPSTIEVMRKAPSIADRICSECSDHFAEVRDLLDAAGVEYTIEPRLVRGLDYYTKTTFELVARGLGSQSAVGGGGRYDGLSESLGGPPLPGMGFALGMERLMLVAAAGLAAAPGPQVYVIGIGGGAGRAALLLALRLRRAGIGADLDPAGRSMKRQLKEAARSRARWAAIVGDQELEEGAVTLKDLDEGTQERVDLHRLEEKLRG